jgi:ribosome-interacting GTPase 1
VAEYGIVGLKDEIEAIEEEIAETPYNKSTEAHIGRLKAKLAEKKEEFEKRQSSGSSGPGYAVEQTGDATVALVGFPSVGKSTLINALTNADSETGAYDFTTLNVNPGMLQYRGANIQLLDVPGLISGAAEGRGGGQEVLSVVRSADLIVFVLSVFEIDQYEPLREELYANKIRLDTGPPSVNITRKGHGGIDVTTGPECELGEDTIVEVLRQNDYVNADVVVRGSVDVDELVDGVMDNRVYLPSLVTVNKADLIEPDYLDTVHEQLRNHDIDPDEAIFVSAETEQGLDGLKDEIWEALGLVRIYMDKPGRGVDWDDPLVLREGATVADACSKLGGEMEERFRFARVSGPSAKHDDQQVGEAHELADEDVVRLLLRR